MMIERSDVWYRTRRPVPASAQPTSRCTKASNSRFMSSRKVKQGYPGRQEVFYPRTVQQQPRQGVRVPVVPVESVVRDGAASRLDVERASNRQTSPKMERTESSSHAFV